MADPVRLHIPGLFMIASRMWVAPKAGMETRSGADDSRRIARAAERRVKAFGTSGTMAAVIPSGFSTDSLPGEADPHSASLIV